MTDFDVFVIMVTIFTAGVLGLIKASIHFDYLKREKGYFKDVDSFTYFILRPFAAFQYFPEFFIIFYIPIFWNLKQNSYLRKIGIISYTILFLLVFVFFYIKVAGS